MSGIEQAANDLFFKLRNRFPNINMADENSQTTSNPEQARFFNFDYEESEIKFGNIAILTIPKHADLLANTILKIILPTFNYTQLNNDLYNKFN